MGPYFGGTPSDLPPSIAKDVPVTIREQMLEHGSLRDPDAERIAADHDLALVPGRFVLELRPAGVDKGAALSELVEASSPRAVLFAGDDLGDLPAVSVVRDLPVSALIVCADSPETPSELRDAADLVVDGPDGVVELLGDLPG